MEMVVQKTSFILKYVSLTMLVLQTTVLVLLLRYSRTAEVVGPRYVSSTAIVISEILKLLASYFVLFKQSECSLTKASRTFSMEVLTSRDTFKLFIPAFLYTVQNNLLFLALSNLDAATYQVTYQLKILTTALFSVVMLHKRLEVNQWLSLGLLMLGVTLVQWPEEDSDVKARSPSYSIGLLAVLTACFSSGFSGVYFQKILQGHPQSLWIRNIQLALCSLFLGFLAVILQDWLVVSQGGFFQGYNGVTWGVIFLQAFGGLVVSTVMKYADNILKGFATSISVVLSTLCSYYYFGDIHLTRFFVLGASVVIIATILYGFKPRVGKETKVEDQTIE